MHLVGPRLLPLDLDLWSQLFLGFRMLVVVGVVNRWRKDIYRKRWVRRLEGGEGRGKVNEWRKMMGGRGEDS